MKKPALAAMGLIGTCAACCTIPLALPLLGGLSAAGLASIDWSCLTVGGELAAAMAGVSAAGLVIAGVWWFRRRKAAAARCATPAPQANGSGCGCASTAVKERA
ncbi:MAG: hypothetical protein V4864_04255 [Pseudomonadota bacterium]